MSSIGPSHPAAFNLAGSFAGAQRNSAAQDETKAQQASQKFQVEQNQTADKDVAEAEMDADRDADGRQGWVLAEHPEQSDSESQNSAAGDGDAHHAPDAFGVRGGQLDLDA